MSSSNGRPARLQAMLTGMPLAVFAAVARYPAPLFFAFAAAVAAVASIHANAWHLSSAMQGALQRVLLIWTLALPVGTALALAFWESRQRPLIQFLAICAALTLWFFLPPQLQNLPGSFWFKYWLAAGAILLMSAVLAGGWRTGRTFWDAVWPLLASLLLAGIAAVIAIIGICLALVSIDKLFGIHFVNAYQDVFVVGFFLLWPAGTLARLSDALPSPPVSAPGWLLVFARWVFLPLCAVYAAILYVYAAKIVIGRHWPEGWVAMPVLLLGAVGMVAYQIARPIRDRLHLTWATAVCRVFPWVLGPLTVLLLLGIRVRVVEYGLTEWRAIGLVLGTWLIGASIAIAWRPQLRTGWLPLSLALLMIISSAGPTSITSLSLRSQQMRLESLVAKLGLMRESHSATSHEIDNKSRQQLQDNLRYLVANHGAHALPSDIYSHWQAYREHHNHETDDQNTYEISNEILVSLGVSANDGWSPRRFGCDGSAIAPQGANAIYTGSVLTEFSKSGAASLGPFSLDIKDGTLQLIISGAPIEEAALSSLMHRLAARKSKSYLPDLLPPAELETDFSWKGRFYRLIFTTLELRISERKSSSEPAVGQASVVILER